MSRRSHAQFAAAELRKRVLGDRRMNVLDTSVDYIRHSPPRTLPPHISARQTMKNARCLHGVRDATLIGPSNGVDARAVGIRISDNVPVAFDIEPTPRHRRDVPVPPGFSTQRIVPLPTASDRPDACLLLGDASQRLSACISSTKTPSIALLVDDREGERTSWPDVWKMSDDGQLIGTDGRGHGRLTLTEAGPVLVLSEPTGTLATPTIRAVASDEEQPHPWGRDLVRHRPQELVDNDGDTVQLPGAPYTLVRDGGQCKAFRIVSVDDMATLIIPRGWVQEEMDKEEGEDGDEDEARASKAPGGPLVRHVYTDNFITDARAYVPPPGAAPSICLTMIVKDEGATIRRALDNARSVADCFCICDTGSSDETLDIIEQFLTETGSKGRVFKHPFRDFGYNRTVAWAAGRGLASYQLFLDADHVLQARSDFDPSKLKEDSYLVEQNTGGCTYWNLRLAKDDEIRCCDGVTHEFWRTKSLPRRLMHLRVVDVGDGGAKSDKYERDLRLLKRQLVHTPLDARTRFYYANTLRDLGRFEEATAAYEKRIELGGWPEEVWSSELSKGRIALQQGNGPVGVSSLLDAYQTDSARAENLVELATYYRVNEKPVLASQMCALALSTIAARPQNPRLLFIEEDSYAWKCLYELSLVRYFLGERGEMLDPPLQAGLFKLLAIAPIPSEHLLANHRFYVGPVPPSDDPVTLEVVPPYGHDTRILLWCTAGATSTHRASGTPFVLAGWGERGSDSAIVTWSEPGAEQSTAASMEVQTRPLLMGGNERPWLLTLGGADSMLLAAWPQQRRMISLERMPSPTDRDSTFRRGEALYAVTNWVPFRCAQIKQGECAPESAPLPWRDVRPVGSVDAGDRGTWFLLRLGSAAPAVYSIFCTGGGARDRLSWGFVLTDEQGDPCGFWLEKDHLVIPAVLGRRVSFRRVPLSFLRWSAATECV